MPTSPRARRLTTLAGAASMALFSALALMMAPTLAHAGDKAEKGATADKDDADKSAKPQKDDKEDKPPAAKTDAKDAADKDATSDVDDGEVRKYTVGVHVLELNKFDLATESFAVEFELDVECAAEPCKPDLIVSNGRIIGKPEVIRHDKKSQKLKYKAEATAVVDLSNYPFDEHLLPLTIEGKDSVHTVLALEKSSVKEGIKLPGWEITGFEGDVVTQDDGDGTKTSVIEFAVDVRRPTLMALFKSVIPVLIMMFVAAFTLLLKPKTAQARLNAATGGLMAVVMFQVGQVGSLPPLGYLTRFDKFMVATYLIYLVNIALSVAIVRFDEQKNERAADKAYLLAAGLVPGMALVLWTGVLSGLFG